jgi:hypothetical protein
MKWLTFELAVPLAMIGIILIIHCRYTALIL